MAISTFSKFYFGTEIELTNNKIDIDEGGGELTGTIDLGVYSLTGLAVALQQELNAIGNNAYTVTIDRDARTYTILSDNPFDLLIDTGTNSSSGVYSEIGFTGSTDLTGLSTYASDSAVGDEYITQFAPQSYVAVGQRKEKGDASINETASGIIEVISFGDVQYVEMDLMFITDAVMDGKVIRNNPTGVQDAIDFLTFATKRGPIEFMPDTDDSSTYFEVVLDRTQEDGKGTKFKLKEETGKSLPGFYRTGRLDFRVLE